VLTKSGVGASRAFQQPIPPIGSKTQVKAASAFNRNAALREILSAGFRVGRGHEAAVKLLLGPGHDPVQGSLVVFRPGRGTARLAGFWRDGAQCNAGALGEHLQRFAELHAFGFHHEAEHVAADVADPALERLALRVDLQAGPAVIVPRAQADEVAALPPQLQITAHHVDDVDRLPDLFLGIECRAETHNDLSSNDSQTCSRMIRTELLAGVRP